MKIRKAVFPVAGFGTRFLPATKAMPKELLPILDKPLIQYAAEEAIAAGIDTLIFVTGRNKRAIEDHFDANTELENVLRGKGKTAQAEMVRNIIPEGVECIFVRQAEQLGLGHAILCAERVVGDDPFAVLLADDFMTDNELGMTFDLTNSFEKSGKTQLCVTDVPNSQVSNYGVIVPSKSPGRISGLIEKPHPDAAPSNLVSIGRYVLTNDIFQKLRNLTPGVGGEIQLADAINIQAQHDEVEIVKMKGRRFDCGALDGFVAATVYEYSKNGRRLPT